MDLKIIPRKLCGNVNIPPSKSIAHRAIIAAALAKGTSRIFNIDFSEDITATLKGMEALGAKVTIENDHIEIDGKNTLINVNPYNLESVEKKQKLEDFKGEENFKDLHNKITIDCAESGSTLRFLVPLAVLSGIYVNFIGKGNLGKRPLDTYYKIFDEQNIYYSNPTNFTSNSNPEGRLNLTVKGKLKGGRFIIPGNVSSQFVTGLLFTLPLVQEDSVVLIEGNLESRGYVDLTLDVLKEFGVEIVNNNYEEFIIKGNQQYKPKNYSVEGDFSQAAFFLAANRIGNEVNCSGLNMNSSQGDKKIIDVIESYEEEKALEAKALEARGRFTTKGTVVTKNLDSLIIDASQIPDLVPIITVLASLKNGKTKIINAARLRIKECDRLHAISSELNKIGGKVEELEDSLIIEGVSEFTGGEVWSFKDHRIAMSLAIASTRCTNPLLIKDAECVKKSYPNFWNDFKRIGGEINEWNLG